MCRDIYIRLENIHVIVREGRWPLFSSMWLDFVRLHYVMLWLKLVRYHVRSCSFHSVTGSVLVPHAVLLVREIFSCYRRVSPLFASFAFKLFFGWRIRSLILTARCRMQTLSGRWTKNLRVRGKCVDSFFFSGRHIVARLWEPGRLWTC